MKYIGVFLMMQPYSLCKHCLFMLLIFIDKIAESQSFLICLNAWFVTIDNWSEIN